MAEKAELLLGGKDHCQERGAHRRQPIGPGIMRGVLGSLLGAGDACVKWYIVIIIINEALLYS